MMDLIGVALKLNGFQFERIDGSASDVQRRQAIERFREDANIEILLASFGSAGVG